MGPGDGTGRWESLPGVTRGKNPTSEHNRRLPARYLRHEFQLGANKIVRRATAYVCGLGFFDLHVNGQLIGDQLMNPALTGYDKRALYATFDVTPRRAGRAKRRRNRA